jgi:dephospho-CoA kinase
MRRPLRVGLTGGIASGKSHVLRRLDAAGFATIDLDRVAHGLTAPGGAAYAAVVEAFGASILVDGRIDRKKLGAVVFGDAARRKRLEQITHPAIGARFQQRLAELEARGFDGIVLWDAPVMIESGGYTLMEKLVVVATDEATQGARLRARDAIEAAEAERKIKSQMPVAEKAKLADYVIDNAGDRDATERQVREVHGALLRDLAARRRE